jgi:serine/threonine-protein phosphatase 5
MLETPTLVDITIPQNSRLTVCGDIHGKLTV